MLEVPIFTALHYHHGGPGVQIATRNRKRVPEDMEGTHRRGARTCRAALTEHSADTATIATTVMG